MRRQPFFGFEYQLLDPDWDDGSDVEAIVKDGRLSVTERLYSDADYSWKKARAARRRYLRKRGQNE